MKIDTTTSLVLKCCLFFGIVLSAIGLFLSEHEYGDPIMWTGLLIMIVSPFAGVLTVYSNLIKEKDWKWVKVATLLIVIMFIGLIFSMLRN